MELEKRSSFGLKLVGASILLGIIGDLILSDEAWGLSLPLFTAFLIAQVMVVVRFSDQKPSKTSIGLMVSAFVFSLTFLWRDAPELKVLNGLAVFTLIGLAALQATGKRLASATVTEFAVLALAQWAIFLADFCLLLFSDVKWAQELKSKGLGGTSAVGRGLIIATPLVLIFGGLLVSADAGFQHFFDQFTSFDAGKVGEHFVIGACCTVLTGGLLRHIFMPANGPKISGIPYILAPNYHTAYRRTEPFRVGPTEIGIVLGSLNLLFGLFVILQAPYLFGGIQHVLATQHLSYADYARRGFFELVSVVGLAIPVLLGSHALIDSKSSTTERIWRGMSVVMVTLLFVVMQSAVQRMRLYVGFYSLTTERIYVLAALGWMALVLLCFMATTIRGQNRYFPIGAFACLLVTLFGVNVLNPDALIVRYNVAQASPKKPVDGNYLRRLSADATPELVRYSPKLDAATRNALASVWLSDEKLERGHWRSWSISRWLAFAALDGDRPSLLAESKDFDADKSMDSPEAAPMH